MNKILLMLYCFFMFIPHAEAKQIRIAVVDTGYSHDIPGLKVCEDGLKDFTDRGMQDEVGHGTNILSILANELKDVNYCVYIFKYYVGTESPSNYLNSMMIFAYIDIELGNKVDFINYSSSGFGPGKKENALLHSLHEKHIVFVTAAGNDGLNLDKDCVIYPACNPDVVPVGNLNKNGKKNPSSNYGKCIKSWEIGEHICSNGKCFTGTSQATAVHTARLVKKMYLEN